MMECNGNLPDKEEDLSDYTDADESISAPTEILAEFLSAVMLKDYDAALKYCKMILQYEPNHATAKEFYPLIQEKIIQGSAEAVNDVDLDADGEGEGESLSEDSESESSGDNSVSESESESGEEDEDDEEGVEEEEDKPSDSDATTASYSSLEDEEADNHHTPLTPDDNAFVSVAAHNNNNFSDSESPTEPVSQAQLASRLRSQVLPTRL